MYSNISLNFSSDCPHACMYCTINKHKNIMKKNNEQIREDIISGEYARNIINRFHSKKDIIDNISLWGMEPTVNADLFTKLVYPLLDYFPNVKEMMFSTNSWLGYNTLKYCIEGLDDYCRENSRDFHLELQISLDGPTWINDPSRRIGATANTLKVVREIVENLQRDTVIDIQMHTKPTLDTKFMKIMVEDKEKLVEYFRFFDDLQEELVLINRNPKLRLYMSQVPTLVNPGEHTVEDGRVLAAFIGELRKMDVSIYKHYKHPLMIQPMRGLLDACSVRDHNSFSHWGCCSSGRYTANIDNHGDLFSCHALFTYPYMDEEATITYAHTTAKDDDPQRLQYVDLLWSEYPESRQKFCDIIIGALASYGQIDKVYLTDDYLRKLLFYALGGVYCQFGHLESTMSIWAYTTSQFKYFGNGALQEIVGYINDCGMI